MAATASGAELQTHTHAHSACEQGEKNQVKQIKPRTRASTPTHRRGRDTPDGNQSDRRARPTRLIQMISQLCCLIREKEHPLPGSADGCRCLRAPDSTRSPSAQMRSAPEVLPLLSVALRPHWRGLQRSFRVPKRLEEVVVEGGCRGFGQPRSSTVTDRGSDSTFQMAGNKQKNSCKGLCFYASV